MCATEAEILGVVMAHEIGPILLNLSVHMETGIMRGKWDLRDLSDIAEGYSGFTKQQDEVIQAEVARRTRQQNVLDAGSGSEARHSRTNSWSEDGDPLPQPAYRELLTNVVFELLSDRP